VKRSWVIGLGAVVISVFASLQASGQVTFPACTREPTESDIDGAKGAHAAAKQYFEKADYDKAIQYWRDAYNFDCTKPRLLQNIANAYEKKGDIRSAIDVLKIYLDRAPGAPDAITVREKINNLENSLTQAPDGGSPPPVPDAGPPVVADAGVDAAVVVPPPDAGSTPSLLPLGVAGAGLAVAIAGGVLLPLGLSGISDAEERCGGTRECTDDAARKDGNLARTEATIGTIALGVGVLALAGGVVWYFVFPPQQSKAAPASALKVTPTVGPKAGGLTFSGAF
jgi:tetratricopeptide (TPR) repeat protein